MKSKRVDKIIQSRRTFIGGSDARIIMGNDEAALIRLWREKRGEAEPEDLSGNLIVQLGSVTEDLNRSWYERNTGRRFATSSATSGIRSFLGWRPPSTASWRAPRRCSRPSSCCPGRSPRRRRPKSTWPSCSTTCGSPICGRSVLSIITGGGKWVEITIPMDPLYLQRPGLRRRRSSGAASNPASAPPDQCRAAAAAHRGDPHRRHELVELLGGVRRPVPQYPAGLPRPRAGQGRTQGADARGRQGGHRLGVRGKRPSGPERL